MTQQVVVNAGALLTQTFSMGESRTDADGAVTVTVVASDGTEEASAAATRSALGTYTYPLEAHAEVDLLTVTWSGVFSGITQTIAGQVEIVGGHYFALSDLRAMPGLSDPSRFPTAKLAEKRTEAQDDIEREVGVAFVERFAERQIAGVLSTSVRLRPFIRRILSGSLGGVAFTEEQIEAMTISELGTIEWTTGWFTASPLVIRYVHAYRTSPPSEIRDMAMEIARHRLLGWRSFLPNETVDVDELGQQTPAGDSRDQQGPGRITAALREWRLREIGPVFA